MSASILTTQGKNVMLNRAFKSSPDYTVPSQFKVGTTTDTPNIADTSLAKPVYMDSTESVDDCDATTGWTANGTNSVSVNSTTFKDTSALNMVKSDTGSVTVSMSKTTTSRDFTSKTFFLWIYTSADAYSNAAATDALTVRFGSDASNYYQYTRDKTDLTSGGWTLVCFTSTSADSTTGSPTLTACDYTYVAFDTDDASDTLVAGDLIIDTILVASSGDFLKSIEAGYPILDETNTEVTTRYRLTTTQANGHAITTFGEFNTDSTPKLISKDSFTTLSKSNTDDIIFNSKYRLE